MEINYLGVLAGGVAFWVLGVLWYSPKLFGKSWQSMVGMSDEDMRQGNMAMIFGTSFLLMLVMTYGLSVVLSFHEALSPQHGAFHGAMIGVFYGAAAIGINYLYQRKPLKLWLIDAVYQIAGLALAGAVYALIA